MSTLKSLAALTGTCVIVGQFACGGPSDYSTQLNVNINGAGRVISSDGSIDCTSDGAGHVSGNCTMTPPSCVVAGDGSQSSSDTVTTTVKLQAVPADGSTLSDWGFSVDVEDDTPADSADPPSGTFDATGDTATVGVDVTCWWNNTETVTATFAPSGESQAPVKNSVVVAGPSFIPTAPANMAAISQ